MVPIIVLLCVAALLVFLVVMTYRGNGMARYALKRILLLIPTVLLVCVIVFISAAGGARRARWIIMHLSVSNRPASRWTRPQVEHMLGHG